MMPIGGDFYRLKSVDSYTLVEYSEKLGEVPGVEFLYDRNGDIQGIRFHRSAIPAIAHLLPNPKPQGHIGFPVDQLDFDGETALKPPFELRDYQKEAVTFARDRYGSCLFHDLGMGKTAMAIGAMDLPALVVCPATALYGWESALEAFGARVKVLQGSSRGRVKELCGNPADVYVTTYSSGSEWIPHFRRLGTGGALHTLVADEVHMLHKKTLKWSGAWSAIKCQRRIGLTATPVRNRMASLWGCLEAVSPGAWGKKHEFLERYAGASQGPYGMVIGDLTHVEELVGRLQEVVLRRSLEEKEFYTLRPPLARQSIRVELTSQQRKDMFDAARDGAVSKYSRGGGGNPTQLRYMNNQRIEAGRAKLQWIREHREEVFGEIEENRRTLWWFWYKDQANAFRRWLKDNAPSLTIDAVDGGTPPKKRARILREWEQGDVSETRVLVATIGALNAAANLLTCKAAYFVELDYAPINIIQAEKRHHRPGSLHSRVEAHYFTIPDSIDEDISKVLLAKVEESERLFGQSGTVEQISSLLDDSLYQEVC